MRACGDRDTVRQGTNSGAARSASRRALLDPQYREYECVGERKLLMKVIQGAVRVLVDPTVKTTMHDTFVAHAFIFEGKGLDHYAGLLGLDPDLVRVRFSS